MSYEFSGLELLAAAIGWYQRGHEPIPQTGTMPGSRVNASLFYDKGKHSYDIEDLSHNYNDISNTACTVMDVKGNMIPVMAGIALGFDSVTLAKILLEHSVLLDQIDELNFDDPGKTPIQLYEKNLKKATPVHINIEVIKAFSADPTLCAELHNNVSNNPHSMECIGLMHTDEISLWPVSRIEEHARLIMTPTKRVISSEFVSFDFVSSRPEQLSEIPNQSPIDFLKRSGMLSEAVLRKQTGSFSLWEDLLYVATTGQSLQIDMLKAFTKITDKDTVDLIIRGLLSVNAGTLESPMDQEDVSTLLHHTFKDSPAFSQVLDSTVLKLSLLPEVIDAGYGNTYQPSALTHAVLSKPEKLLSRVANELLARPAEHLGYSEYRVFSTLLDMDIAPHVIDFDPERLLNHMLDSISTYRTSNTIICETKLFVDTCALNGLEAIAKLLMPYHTFDCSKFNDRDEASKVALIKAGFGIDRKTISRTARGQILEDEMGL